MVENVKETAQFYKDHLGFELIMSVPLLENFEWAMMRCGDVEIMFQSRSSFGKEFEFMKDSGIGASQTLYFSVNGIEELFSKIRENVEIINELHSTSYGMTEFTMRDDSGYILVFSERL